MSSPAIIEMFIRSRTMARNKYDADEEIEQKLNLRIIPRMLRWIKPYAW